MNNGGEETSQKSKLPYLPDDLIIGILLRSPARSIGRFRCLSKLFCSLLSDPKFARKQLELSLGSNAVRSNNRKLVTSLQNLFLVDFDSINVEREYSSKEDLIFLSELRSNRKFKIRCIDIIGSSNGLVCVRCMVGRHDEFLFYNPTTRESKRIPDLPRSLRCKPHHKWSFRHGFGFDALNIDYKLMKLVYCKDNEHKFTACYVYSLKTDSWRRMTNLVPNHMDVIVCRKNLKGAIHWVAIIEESQRVLIAFDLEKEELREMPLPNLVEEFDFARPFTLDTLKGCLCLVHYFFTMDNVIWVMNEYGLESSWSKIRIRVSEYSMKPLCLTKNDEEVLIAFDGHFVYRKLKIGNEETYMMIMTHTYVESLVSPKSYDGHR